MVLVHRIVAHSYCRAIKWTGGISIRMAKIVDGKRYDPAKATALAIVRNQREMVGSGIDVDKLQGVSTQLMLHEIDET